MKKLLLLLVSGLSFLPGYAQDIPCKVQKSAVFKDEYKRSVITSVDEDLNGGTVIARSYQGGLMNVRSLGYYFEHYDANMKLINEHEHELKDGVVLGVIVNNDKVHVIEFTYVKAEKAYICRSSSADVSNFAFTTKELFRLERDEVKKKGIFNLGQQDGDYFAGMVTNEDKSAFAISIDINDNEDRNELHKIFVYDAGLNLKIEHVFKRKIKDRKFKYEGIDISKDGTTAYLLGKATTPESKSKKDGGKYQYELTRITDSDSKTQVFDTDEHYARSLKTVFKKDKIACVGLYSDRKDSRFKGLCYFDMDPVTLDIKTKKFNPFTEQFIIDKYGKNKDKELKNIKFKGLFLTKNNDIIFNAEETYETVSQSMGVNGAMGTTTRIVYHYDDIVTAKIADNGDLLWARNINKRQATSGDDSYISYSSMVKGDDTYFFINTGEKVKKLSNDRIQFGQKSKNSANLNVIKINHAGDFEYKELLDDDDNEVPFMVSSGTASKKGDIIYFIGRKGKKKQLLKITV